MRAVSYGVALATKGRPGRDVEKRPLVSPANAFAGRWRDHAGD